MKRLPEPESMDGCDEAKAYEQADFAEVNQAFADRTIELAWHLKRAKGADLGTGPADIPMRLVRARPDWRVVAVDAAAAMLALAREHLSTEMAAGSIDLVLADAKKLPFADNSFDFVVSNSIIHHLDQPEDLWSEVKRIARSGAVIFFRDLSRPDSPDAAAQIVERYSAEESDLLKKLFFDSLLASYTPAEVGRQLASVGLTGVTVTMSTDRHWDVVGQVS